MPLLNYSTTIEATKGLPRSKIEYLTHCWNFQSGCLHTQAQCPTADKCWARRLAHRFGHDFAPRFNERIFLARFPKAPARIGVCFTGDLFGDWVPKNRIRACRDLVAASPEHQFLFLTKNPKRYAEFNPWPANAWLGVSITDAESLLEAAEAMEKVEAKIRWASFEPLLGNPRPDKMWKERILFDWVVIGAQTGPGAKKPELEWVVDIIYSATVNGLPVWLKNNLLALYPELYRRQELP